MADGVRIVYIKKKAKGHPHHGGAWKVAYADFVTAMMALFIVLWLLTQSDQASKEKIAEYFRTGSLPGGAMVLGKPGGANPPVPVDIFSASASTSAENKKLDKLKAQVEEMLEADADDPMFEELAKHVTVTVVDGGALIELVDGGDNFLFPLGSSELKATAEAFLSQLAPLLQKMRNKIEVHGHTDSLAFNDGRKTNWQLSFERADRARAILEGNGVSKGKIVGVQAHADTALFNRDDPYAAENRRLSILVVRSNYDKVMRGPEQTDAGVEVVDGKPGAAQEVPATKGADSHPSPASADGGAVPDRATAPDGGVQPGAH